MQDIYMLVPVKLLTKHGADHVKSCEAGQPVAASRVFTDGEMAMLGLATNTALVIRSASAKWWVTDK